MTATSTARVIAFRERQKRDEVLLTVRANRVVLLDTLRATNSLDQSAEDDNQTLATGIENLLERLQRKIP
jgi:hypothetical protein